MLGIIDVVGGTAANLIAASLIFYMRRRLFPACIVGSMAIGVMPVWAAMVISIALSSIIAIAGIGYLLVRALCRSGFVEVLESRGMKTYLEK